MLVKAESVNTFRGRLDILWNDEEVKYNWKVVLCEYSKFRIESNSYLLFDSKLMQLFEIFEYLFNRDQPGD